MDSDAVDYFVRVAEAGSLSRAAKLHSLPKSSLSHKIRQLEDELATELFLRDGRDMVLTDAGTEFLAHAHRIRASCDEAKAAIAEMRQEIVGTLTIGSTGEFGTAFTSELMFAFRQRFPQVKLDVLFLSPGYLFTLERQSAFDAVFFWGEPGDVDYVARRLSSASYGLFASPGYLAQYGTPDSPDDLHQHRGALFRRPTGVHSWHLEKGGESIDLIPQVNFTANDYWMVKYFAVAGDGIAYLPGFFTETECSIGRLVPVLPEWQSPEIPINLLYPRRRYVSRKFSALLDFCVDFYRDGGQMQVPRYFIESVT